MRAYRSAGDVIQLPARGSIRVGERRDRRVDSLTERRSNGLAGKSTTNRSRVSRRERGDQVERSFCVICFMLSKMRAADVIRICNVNVGVRMLPARALRRWKRLAHREHGKGGIV